MAMGYVLITTKPAMEHHVYRRLCDEGDIDELFPLFSDYDLICRVEAEDTEGIGKLVEEKIKSIEGVLVTKTLMGY